jgi:hypothetical protein
LSAAELLTAAAEDERDCICESICSDWPSGGAIVVNMIEYAKKKCAELTISIDGNNGPGYSENEPLINHRSAPE